MEEQNILASDIQKTRKKQYDASCKALLAEKAILARLLKSCIPDFKDCSIEDITSFERVATRSEISLAAAIGPTIGIVIMILLTELLERSPINERNISIVVANTPTLVIL